MRQQGEWDLPEDNENSALSQEAQQAIAQGLRNAYGVLLEAPLPEKFADLLAALANPEKKS
ncbi:MAG: NepR family anti-sigma factor [Hyphomicrobiaceae bacterium]